ncbi:RICIN domain-containing protein [Bacillus toyonensis]
MEKYMEIRNDTYYKIVNMNSGLVADVKAKSTSNSALLEQLAWQNETFQQWLVFQLDGELYAFTNRNSGLIMDVKSKSTSNSADLEQLDWYGETFQQWMISETDTEGYYKITNQNSGLVMDVKGKSTSNSALLEQLDWYNESFQKWAFEPLDSITLPSVETQPLPNVPQYTSADENTLPDQTDPVITNYTLMPCIMVTDNNWSASNKITNTPYYMLIKTQYWKKIDSHTFAPNTKYTSTTEYGMNQTDQESMTETTSISVTADAGFSFGKMSSSISTTVTNELQVSKSTTTELMTDVTTTEEISNPYTYEIKWTKYALVTQYDLKRADGTSVTASWTVIDKNEEQESYYPLDSPPEVMASKSEEGVK